MHKFVDFIKKIFLKKEFALFVAIGIANTFNGTVLALIYSLFVQTNIAFVLGYITGLVIAFFLNTSFVFHSKLGVVKFIKFSVSYIPSFIIQNILVIILYNGLYLNSTFVFVLAAAVGVPITFLILKMFAFKK